MYEGPTADELCSVGWYIHACMFFNFYWFCTLLYIPVPSVNKVFIIIIIIIILQIIEQGNRRQFESEHQITLLMG